MNEAEDELSTIEKTVFSDYKYGFVTDIEADEAPKGLNEDVVRFISARKEGTGMDAGMAVKGLPALADDERTQLGEC